MTATIAQRVTCQLLEKHHLPIGSTLENQVTLRLAEVLTATGYNAISEQPPRSAGRAA